MAPLVALALLAACASPGTAPVAAPTTPVPVPSPSPGLTVAATPTATPYLPAVGWKLGASPLPLAANGFGKVLPTPKVLRNRRLPTLDVLPPPSDGRFHSSTGPITPALRQRMGRTYQPNCPVGLDQLRYLRLTFRGFDGKAHTGELVVAAKVSGQVVAIFRDLFALGFPIEQMTLPTTGDVDARPTGDGNTTAGFVCRAARGQTRFSAHAYGLAIDVNSFTNPYRKGALVLPELASAYTDRTWVRPGMFVRGSAEVRAFTSRGWTWGGTYTSLKDWMHFSVTGG
jgi:hypothetical protein